MNRRKHRGVLALVLVHAMTAFAGCGDEEQVFECVVGTSWDDDFDPATACIPVTECLPGEIETAPPTPFFDRVCITDCEPLTWDDDGDPSTECVAVSVCDEAEYQAMEPTWNTDRVCATITECGLGTEETRTPTPLRDRVCTPCLDGNYCPGGAAPAERCYFIDNDPTEPCKTVVALDTGGYDTCMIDDADRLRCSSPQAASGVTRAVSVGSYHACAADGDGEVTCWGNDGNGAFMVPSELTDVVAMSCSHIATCAIDGNQDVTCWGMGGPVIDVPSDLDDIVQVAAGQFHACALSDAGGVRCWGTNNNGEQTVPVSVGTVVAISAADNLNCAVNDEGDVTCWGSSTYSRKVIPASLGPAIAISVGSYSVCAIEVGGTVECWGSGTAGAEPVPTDLGPATSISVGSYWACALDGSGQPKCWPQ